MVNEKELDINSHYCLEHLQFELKSLYNTIYKVLPKILF